MLTTQQLAGARKIRERAMVDTCTIRVPGGTVGSFDPVTGTRTTTPFAAYYTGKCRVMDSRSIGADALAGEQQVTTLSYLVEVPQSVTDVGLEHIVTITASRDPWLVGRSLTVSRVRGLTFSSSRILVCVDDLETPSGDA